MFIGNSTSSNTFTLIFPLFAFLQRLCSSATSSQTISAGCGKKGLQRCGRTLTGRDIPARLLQPIPDPGLLPVVTTTCISSPATLGPPATKPCKYYTNTNKCIMDTKTIYMQVNIIYMRVNNCKYKYCY